MKKIMILNVCTLALALTVVLPTLSQASQGTTCQVVFDDQSPAEQQQIRDENSLIVDELRASIDAIDHIGFVQNRARTAREQAQIDQLGQKLSYCHDGHGARPRPNMNVAPVRCSKSDDRGTRMDKVDQLENLLTSISATAFYRSKGANRNLTAQEAQLAAVVEARILECTNR
ncbi:MAG: hypothetical protein AB7O96_03150 [Pseudobdellovibrionaceae bacterium]